MVYFSRIRKEAIAGCSTRLQSGPIVVFFRHEMFSGSVFAVAFKQKMLIISIRPPGLLHRLG